MLSEISAGEPTCTTKWHHRSHMQQKDSLWDIFEIPTANNVIYTLAEKTNFNFRINKILSYSSFLKTLVPPNLCLLLRLCRILHIFIASFSSSLNKLNALRPSQKFEQIDNTQNLRSALHHSITAKSSSFENGCVFNTWGW